MDKTFVIAGCGHLGRIWAQAYRRGVLEGYRFLAAYSRNIEDAVALAEISGGGKACATVQELLALKPDYLLEAASIELLKTLAKPALEQGINVIPLSIGAFADEVFKGDCMDAARRRGVKIHIPTGAVGAFDVLETVQLMASQGVVPGKAYGTDEGQARPWRTSFHSYKHPSRHLGTDLFTEKAMNEEMLAFEGTAREAIELLPHQINVAVATALAGRGPGETRMKITTIPDFVGDEYVISAELEGVRFSLDIYSATSDIAAWSVIALLRNLASPMMFF